MIQETDLAYSKIVESSQMLLTVLKRESAPLACIHLGLKPGKAEHDAGQLCTDNGMAA